MRIAVIQISPENPISQIDVQTNGVSNLDMLEFLNTLVKHFAKSIVEEAKQIGCSDKKDFDGYVEFLRKNKL